MSVSANIASAVDPRLPGGTSSAVTCEPDVARKDVGQLMVVCPSPIKTADCIGRQGSCFGWFLLNQARSGTCDPRSGTQSERPPEKRCRPSRPEKVNNIIASYIARLEKYHLFLLKVQPKSARFSVKSFQQIFHRHVGDSAERAA